MISRLIDLPLQQNTMASAKLADLVITPDLEGYTSADFVKGAEMIPLGQKAALADRAKLETWSEPASVYQRLEAGPRCSASAAAPDRRGRDRPGARAWIPGGSRIWCKRSPGRCSTRRRSGRT